MAYSDTGSRKRGCMALIGFGALLLALPVGWLMGRPYTSTIPRSFETLAWQRADPTGWPADNTRCGMIADLRIRVGIEGKSRDDLLKLLGKPEKLPSAPNREYWPLCPSFLDIWVLTVRWKDGRAIDAAVHDT